MPDELTRRALIRKGLIAGGAATGAGALGGLVDACGSSAKQSGTAKTAVPGPAGRAPNILVLLVDQLRTPMWFQQGALAAGMMPNLQRLRKGGVHFTGHYTAANDCSPSRGVLLTGLHSQQTGCLVTGGSTLAPQFPTWGTMLREHGYETWWYGKWHLTHNDNRWTPSTNAGALERYGFSGGTYPSPDGGPGQGWRVDPLIAAQFKAWYAGAPRRKPWCTTVSFVNPHDIAWWYRWSSQAAPERRAPHIVGGLPANFETPEEMRARHKPRLQHSLQETAQVSFGKVPYSGPHMTQTWLPFMDLYLKLLNEVDRHIGQVLDTLHSRPEIAANTVIVLTSDHGEYGASHGMRGKGASAYEEALRVPLVVKDPRGKLSAAPATPRTGLTSSVDVAPLLLTIATGSGAWRSDPRYSQIADRHDLAKMLLDPAAPGRPYVLHCTDEIVTEFAIELYSAKAPLHVTAIRTPTAKYALYSDWRPGTSRINPSGQEAELYDYSTRGGRLEIDNLAGRSELEPHLRSQLEAAIANELRAPLPARLHAAQQDGYADYHSSAQKAAIKATRLRRKIEESEPPSRAAAELGKQ